MLQVFCTMLLPGSNLPSGKKIEDIGDDGFADLLGNDGNKCRWRMV